MIIDILLFLILTVVMALGYRGGFIHTFLHLAGWFLALGFGFFLTPSVKAHLISADYFYTGIHDKLLDKMPGGIAADSLQETGIPLILRDFINGFTATISENVATALTDLIMTIISFLLIVILVKLILNFISLVFSKKKNDGAIGFIDGLMGLAFGFFKGMIILYVILALMIPVINLASPDHTFTLLTSLDSSVIAKDLYNNNPLLLLTNHL